ncbi:hypothetical protein J5J86_12715 [Aquabacter sp. L1I39]|uniref:hypothetical protein n=1 Tax=Aquabacter sp. L1I39 TaxID=2820278 RepID=UPI001ADCB48A|nr:hypothetical protein [Aquabacter sp. L1I39]QTL01680.1 hypothetical protein J5J86_12715 [Aquabacter sp. L1I39]
MHFVRTLTVVLLAVSPFAFSGSAAAQGMPQTLDMTCSEAQALVNRTGAAVLATGPNVFNRYVKDLAFCPEAMVTKPAWLQTKDMQQCPIGYTCWDPTTDTGGR